MKAFQREWPLTSCTCRFFSFYPFVQPSIFLFRYNRLELLCFQYTHHSTTILAVRFQKNGETTYRSSASLSQLTHTHTRDGKNGRLFFFFFLSLWQSLLLFKNGSGAWKPASRLGIFVRANCQTHTHTSYFTHNVKETLANVYKCLWGIQWACWASSTIQTPPIDGISYSFECQNSLFGPRKKSRILTVINVSKRIGWCCYAN